MSNAVPWQRRTYKGPITDTTRWENFRHRSDDIFICTPLKCGTTWTQAICAMLVFGEVDHGIHPSLSSPWIDAQFAPIEDYLERVDAQTHRRYFKTHSPLDGIPYYPECTYLMIVRDPRDVYCSNLNHRDNMSNEDLALYLFTSGENAFMDWLTREQESGGWDKQSLHSLAHFLRTYWNYRDLPNIHLFHYTDMKRDLKATIAAMAKALSVEIEEEALDAMTEAADFNHMKRNAEKYVPESGRGFWKQDGDFFASGNNEQWKDILSNEDLLAFDTRLAELLSPEQAQWLLNGSA